MPNSDFQDRIINNTNHYKENILSISIYEISQSNIDLQVSKDISYFTQVYQGFTIWTLFSPFLI